MRSLSILTLLFLTTAVFAADFGGRTEFTTMPVRGDLHITCQANGQYDSRYVRCSDERLNPWEVGFINAEKNIDADEIIVVSQRSDGKRVEKKSSYDSKLGQSSSRLNLWIETVFQTALLDIGKNPISYELRKNGRKVLAGNFEVLVKKGALSVCPRGSEFSFDQNDCDFPSNACDRYFRSYSWCQ